VKNEREYLNHDKGYIIVLQSFYPLFFASFFVKTDKRLETTRTAVKSLFILILEMYKLLENVMINKHANYYD
jgi:hypothetical protein